MTTQTLVRDRSAVPAEPCPMDDRTYYLKTKLAETLLAFLTTGGVEHLADLMDVAYATAEWTNGMDENALNTIRFEKAEQEGTFSEYKLTSFEG